MTKACTGIQSRWSGGREALSTAVRAALLATNEAMAEPEVNANQPPPDDVRDGSHQPGLPANALEAIRERQAVIVGRFELPGFHRLSPR